MSLLSQSTWIFRNEMKMVLEIMMQLSQLKPSYKFQEIDPSVANKDQMRENTYTKLIK